MPGTATTVVGRLGSAVGALWSRGKSKAVAAAAAAAAAVLSPRSKADSSSSVSASASNSIDCAAATGGAVSANNEAGVGDVLTASELASPFAATRGRSANARNTLASGINDVTELSRAIASGNSPISVAKASPNAGTSADAGNSKGTASKTRTDDSVQNEERYNSANGLVGGPVRGGTEIGSGSDSDNDNENASLASTSNKSWSKLNSTTAAGMSGCAVTGTGSNALLQM